MILELRHRLGISKAGGGDDAAILAQATDFLFGDSLTIAIHHSTHIHPELLHSAHRELSLVTRGVLNIVKMPTHSISMC